MQQVPYRCRLIAGAMIKQSLLDAIDTSLLLDNLSPNFSHGRWTTKVKDRQTREILQIGASYVVRIIVQLGLRSQWVSQTCCMVDATSIFVIPGELSFLLVSCFT